MQVVRGFASLPLDAGPTSVTIGFFDGVHRGHQQVIRRTVDVSRARDLHPVAITFDRHPREVFAPGTEPPLLTTLARKASLVADLGIEALIVLEFTQEFAAWAPEEFIDRVLVRGLRAGQVVVGSNFTFGHQAAGTLTTLALLCLAEGYHRGAYFSVALVCAVLTWIGGLVIARFLGSSS